MSFPLAQRLTLAGAMRDASVPAPKIKQDGDDWDVAVSDGSDDEAVGSVEGVMQENKARFVHDSLDMTMALDPDVHPEDVPPEPGKEFSELDADLEDVRKIDTIAREELQVDGTRPPRGWHIDRFGGRLVSVPPWSRRPPDCEPEVWTNLGKKFQDQLRDEWKAKDPAGFAKQEERRTAYEELKAQGKVRKSLPVRWFELACGADDDTRPFQ